MSIKLMKEFTGTQQGYSLLEVLISMLIIMFGLLGMAGMQVMALNNTETARYSSVASVLASDIGARIVGNISYWGTPPSTVSITNNSGSVALSGGPTPSSTSLDCKSAACSASDLAYYDLQEWGTIVINSFPSGTAKLACDSTQTPAVCTVTISWSEKNLGVFNPTGTESGNLATGSSQTHSFQTLVSIL